MTFMYKVILYPVHVHQFILGQSGIQILFVFACGLKDINRQMKYK